jgi:hypothetical protein
MSIVVRRISWRGFKPLSGAHPGHVAVWNAGARRTAAGYVIILLGSLLGTSVPIFHFRGAGGVVGGEIAKSSGAFFFVWTLIVLGVTAMFSLVLSARELGA